MEACKVPQARPGHREPRDFRERRATWVLRALPALKVPPVPRESLAFRVRSGPRVRPGSKVSPER